jgi:Xaa-Pro aminopeptidase
MQGGGSSKAGGSAFSLDDVSAQARDSLIAYGLGNGVGLDLTEDPSATIDSIQAGMVLTLRTCFTGEQSGSALISRPYLVTESGLEPLARGHEKLIAIGD